MNHKKSLVEIEGYEQMKDITTFKFGSEGEDGEDSDDGADFDDKVIRLSRSLVLVVLEAN